MPDQRAGRGARERAHVIQIEHDPVEWLFSVSCFCGWEADTAFDEREDAEAEYQRHKAERADPKADPLASSPKSRTAEPDATPIGPESAP